LCVSPVTTARTNKQGRERGFSQKSPLEAPFLDDSALFTAIPNAKILATKQDQR
jgi:hypothetical protein